jgi:hypothetical protein
MGTKVTKLEYTFKTDTLFKILFVQYPDLLKSLVSELLSIRIESIGQFVITNPEMPPEVLGDKFCRLDINMTVDGQRVDLEIQLLSEISDKSCNLIKYIIRVIFIKSMRESIYWKFTRIIKLSQME